MIRPVSARPNEEVSESERQYRDGTDPKLLDIIRVPILNHRPINHQTENYVINPERYWMKDGTLDWPDLDKLVDNPASLWGNDWSSYAGQHDRVKSQAAAKMQGSLFLVHQESVRIRVFAPGAAFGNQKRRIQAKFRYKRVDYGLWITDPIVERQYLAGDDGEFEIAESHITVSLGQSHDDGYCYKFVAAIIRCNR